MLLTLRSIAGACAISAISLITSIASAQTPSPGKMVVQSVDHEYLTVSATELGETHKNVATLQSIFQAIFKQDWLAIRSLYDDQFYTQHNPDMKDKVEGVIELFQSLDYKSLVYEPVLQIAEGPYVAVLSKLQFAPNQPTMAVVDINFIRDGKSREHWDIIQPFKGPNGSGRTPFDIVMKDAVKVDQQTVDANKRLVADMINEVFNRKQPEKVRQYIGEPYYQHGMGKDGYEDVVRDISERFPDVRVDIKRIIGQNDLVLAHARVFGLGKEFSRVDIWRVRDKKWWSTGA
ncbi:MAG: nuclear transport factor 2 family protein [Betaproteobacteria bacterium]|nr:nuclear transport factor 2 family protein [Betaproteobacteria bacterium]